MNKKAGFFKPAIIIHFTNYVDNDLSYCCSIRSWSDHAHTYLLNQRVMLVVHPKDKPQTPHKHGREYSVSRVVVLPYLITIKGRK